MDVVFVGLALLGFAIWGTHGTRVWWIPGSVLLLAAVLVVVVSGASAGERDDYGLQGMADFIVLAAAGGMGLLGLIVLAFMGSARTRSKPSTLA